jgi:PEP-CTERM motif
MKNALKVVSGSLLVLAGSLAQATVLTSVGTCSTSSANIGGIAASSCLGYYSGSLTNAADFTNVVDTLIAGGFTGPYAAYSGPNALNEPTTFTTTTLSSSLVVGVHWGGQGGGHTAFYKWTGLTPANSFLVDFVNNNPFLNNGTGAFSNAYLYQSSSSSTSSSSSGQVPLPGTVALLGLGLIGLGLRGRKQ